MKKIAGLMMLMMAGAAAGTPASADTLAVPHFGAIVDVPGAQMRPDASASYHVVFGVTKAAPASGSANPSLDRVARFVNLLAHYGVPRDHVHVVAIVSGPATGIVAKAGTTPSPDAQLVAELIAAGVSIDLCSQAAHAHGLAQADLLPGVRLDVSAITTIATLQAQGYAYLPD
jgi:intracellular sulfur oxidation DsrE/DsrF family protein